MEETNRTPEASPIKKSSRQEISEKRKAGTLSALIISAFILVFAAVTVLKPDRKFSPNENRNLAGRPAFSVSGLLDGSFAQGLTERFSDQFLMRDTWISLKAFLDRATGLRESHGVYIGRDNWLFAAPEEPDMEALQKIADAVNGFAASAGGVSTRMMLVPCACAVMPDLLPADAPVRNQAYDIERFRELLGSSTAVNFIDPTEVLRQHRNEQLYYRTDHHWTCLGSRIVFEASAAALGIEQPVSSYQAYALSNMFLGTLGSQSGNFITRDAIVIYVPDSEVQYYISIPDEGITQASLYFSAKLEEKDQYQVFLGGNHPLVEIRTSADTGKNLLLFKDSYANSFVQYLIPYYDKIIMVDPRYYYDSASQLVSREGITDILFLYSANTLFTDNSLADCLNA